jgi:hypothetical protein
LKFRMWFLQDINCVVIHHTVIDTVLLLSSKSKYIFMNLFWKALWCFWLLSCTFILLQRRFTFSNASNEWYAEFPSCVICAKLYSVFLEKQHS